MSYPQYRVAQYDAIDYHSAAVVALALSEETGDAYEIWIKQNHVDPWHVIRVVYPPLTN
jgi:hypothetical protein